MTDVRRIRVVVDAAGGDRAPGDILRGVEIAHDTTPGVEIVLTGPEEVVVPFAAARERVIAHPTTEIILMDEHPASAVRAKPDSSIVAGCRLVRDGEADAFFSAGSTGAAMTAATLVMGRIPGVARPAIATVIPTAGAPAVLLDAGANAECKPEHLLAFGHMGVAYAQTVLGVANPRVALLNIGEEPSKGSQLAIDAHALMAEHLSGFVGNIEGRDILSGAVDVIVTDGFTGNISLKLLEGASKTLLGQLKAEMTATLPRKLAAAVLAPGLRRLKERLDPETYGGAPLLGVRGVCIIGHGSSGSRAVAAAVNVAATAVSGDLTGSITRAVARESL
ncbi:MAG: phosphate acyltransferase PlsX [Clostridiales bacterium]|nr:phosphate acyltransferase PlsX [Clostridiales bacterium]